MGRVFCDGPTAKIETRPIRLEAILPFDPPALYDKLEFLVGSAVGDTFAALMRVRSGFWSFIEVQDGANRPGAS